MVKDLYNPYEKYGLKRVLNAATQLTRLGGSIPSPEVFRAMEDASKSFVYIPELQAWAGKIIAEATGAEAGLPTAGAANALQLAAAACIMKGTELEKYDPLGPITWTPILQKLPRHTEGLRTEFIVQKCDRSLYDNVVEYVGGQLVEVGTADGATEKELDDAFNPEKTAGYYYTVRTSYKPLPLKTVIKIAHRHGVPVIVDAASELPPKKNLRKYIAMGVDLVIFSGGKDISGPNNSGILAGRKDLVKLAHLQAYPFQGVGRVAKMSRETIVGFIVALNTYLELDEEARFKAWEKKVKWIAEQLNAISNVKAEVFYQTTVEENEPFVPTVAVRIDEKTYGMTAKDLSNKLKEGNPSIEASYEAYYLGPNSSGTMEFYKGKLAIDPQCLLEGEESIIVEKIKETLTMRKIQPIKQK